MNQALAAERAALAILMKRPDLFFSVDDVLSAVDFSNAGNKMIYSLINNVLTSDKNSEITPHVLLSTAEHLGMTKFLEYTFNGEVLDVLEDLKSNVNPANLNRHVMALKKATVQRRMISVFDELKDDIEEYAGDAIDLKNMIEDRVFGELKVINDGENDIVNLSDDFEDTINTFADNDGVLGIDIGLSKWQIDSGQIRNGTVAGVFARAKTGKSQLAAHAQVHVAIRAENRLPTLYLDTELSARDQQMRMCGMLTDISYEEIESGRWKGDKEKLQKVRSAFSQVKDSPIYYKNIAGQSIHHVIPVIRKFVHKYGGGIKEGDEPRCLVIYDYIKLMSSADLKNVAEWQMLGFLLSQLHDAAVNLNIPILAFGQLNKEAFKIDSEIAVAGADRLNWNLDSVSILRKKKPEEIETDGLARGNYLLKVLLARRGPGHDYDEWINLFFKKDSGQFNEDKRNSEVIQAIQNSNNNLADDDIAPFGSIKE
jgi:replicative DNA helicase